jgi:hypothetical protein
MDWIGLLKALNTPKSASRSIPWIRVAVAWRRRFRSVVRGPDAAHRRYRGLVDLSGDAFETIRVAFGLMFHVGGGLFIIQGALLVCPQSFSSCSADRDRKRSDCEPDKY